jgi:DNA-binding transcriptional LysR family regulator
MGALELHHLRCTVAIAEHGSFSAAATALHLTQPSLSYSIARLERELGTRLFDRSPARTTLTATGEAFLGPARRAIAEADSARTAVQAVTGLLTGNMRIASIRTAVVETAQQLAHFRQQHPGVRLIVHEPGSDRDVVEAVRSATCDIGIMRTLGVPSDLPSTPIGTQELAVVFPAALAPRRAHITLGDLAGTPLVAPLAGTKIRAAHDELLREHGVEPTVGAECSHLETIIELVRTGIGAAITSSSRAATLGESGLAIRRVRPKFPTDLCAVWRPESSAPAAAAFVVLVRGS